MYGVCFHEWAMVSSDARGSGWLREFLSYAIEREVEILSYTDYWRRVSAAP